VKDLDLQVGPVADRVTIWPHDGGSYGVDATFQGLSGYDDLEYHERVLNAAEVRSSVLQEAERRLDAAVRASRSSSGPAAGGGLHRLAVALTAEA
jgi:hypothetical protein